LNPRLAEQVESKLKRQAMMPDSLKTSLLHGVQIPT
jgi:hypothetical protein